MNSCAPGYYCSFTPSVPELSIAAIVGIVIIIALLVIGFVLADRKR